MSLRVLNNANNRRQVTPTAYTYYHNGLGHDITIHNEYLTSRDSTNGMGIGLTNEGFVDGALELGVKMGNFIARIQGVLDDRSNMNGAGLLELRYAAPNFAMWVAGAYTDLDLEGRVTDFGGDIKDTVTGDENEEDDTSGLANWKIGGSFKLGQLIKFGLQYEDAEIGAFEDNPDGGQYILSSLELGADTGLAFAGWVGLYQSDIAENQRMLDKDGSPLDEDALNWAVGIKYLFSKRTQLYLGYRQTDSDNDYRDENVAVMGVRHSF
jgi:predicted porin